MKFIDLHCDTLMHLKPAGGGNLLKNSESVDFARMRGCCMAQFFAIYLPSLERLEKAGYSGDEAYINEKFDIFAADIAACDDVEWGLSYKDLVDNNQNNKMTAFLTMEDGRDVRGSHKRLAEYYNRGIRLITLTWNFKNCFGAPQSADPVAMQEGLTPFGNEAIEHMNELGMIIDVSHLSDGGFWDVVKRSKKPFMASHSNARALAPHPRNLTDEMIKAVANSGGVAGLNFAPHFLNEDRNNTHSSVPAMVRHMRYIADIGGVGVLALGSDLDGIIGQLDIDSVDKIPNLLDALSTEFNSSEIEQIAYGNALRVLKEVL